MPRAVVITGPSGVGKGTLIRSLRERMPELELSVSATTRRPRTGETHGVDYHFMSEDEFERHVRDGDFVEHADYAGARYGTLRSELQTRMASGAPVLLEIEVQGARQVRETMPEAIAGVHRAAVASTRCARASSAAAPTRRSRSRRACAPPSASSPRRTSSPTSSSTTASRTPSTSSSRSCATATAREPTARVPCSA